MAISSNSDLEPIAIIGFAAQLPGKARTVTALWDLILEGENTVSEVPPDRFNIDAFFNKDATQLHATSTRYGNFLNRDLGAFDAGFFSTAPLEAASIDPAQRILLETAYHALENAGLTMEAVAGSDMACYVGASGKDFESLLLRDPDEHAKYTMTGIGTAMLANRISWFFDLRGASFTLDTGCSSSIIGLHQACAAIRAGESETALVGGSNLSIVPDAGIIPLSNMGFLSPDGRCWSFDSRANGFGRADGQGFIVLKSLSAALRDGDLIRALVRSTALNQDGHTPGLTMPSPDSQISNALAAYEVAGLDLRTTAFFEAHGTGTQIGDLIESQAIHNIFNTSHERPLHIGSVKANIGHLEAAAGLGGIFKAIFMLESGVIPREACAGSGEPNPNIPFEEWGLKLATRTIPWPREGVRRISLNSFGYGGSNGHAVLDDALSYFKERGIDGRHLTMPLVEGGSSGLKPPQPNGNTTLTNTNGANGHGHNAANGTHQNGLPAPSNVTRLLILSANDEAGIQRLVDVLHSHVSKRFPPGENIQVQQRQLDSLAYTLSERRSRLPWKSFFLASSIQHVAQSLASKVSKPVRASVKPPLTFIFSGQGANYARMGVDLIPAYTTFRESIEESDRLMRSMGSSWSLLDELHKSPEKTQVSVPKLSQPLSTALQIALFDLLKSWDLCPTTVIGHSSGEIAAAYAIGALTHESAIRVAYFRGVVAGILEDKKIDGSMSSVGLSEEAIAPYIAALETTHGEKCVQVACVNSNTNVTLTGRNAALDALSVTLEKEHIFCRRLAITVPYHSDSMSQVSQTYLQLMGKLEANVHHSAPKKATTSTQTRMYSSVIADIISPRALCDPQYWVDNLVGQVKFYPAFKKLISSVSRPNDCCGQILEVAPHAVLQRSIRDILQAMQQQSNFEYESVLFRNNPATVNCLNAVGHLVCRNIPVNIAQVNNPELHIVAPVPLSDLPNYPFNHSQSYWHESRTSINHRFRKHCRHELIGNRATDWNPLEPRWRNIFELSHVDWLKECTVDEVAMVPASAILVMPIEALRQLDDTIRMQYELTDVTFGGPLVLGQDRPKAEIQIALRPIDTFEKVDASKSRAYTFTVHGGNGNEFELLCSGIVLAKPVASPNDLPRRLDVPLENISAQCTESVSPRIWYRELVNMGYPGQASFQKASAAINYSIHGKAVTTMKAENSVNGCSTNDEKREQYLIHPTLLEAMMQLNKAPITSGGLKKIPRLYPTSLKKLRIMPRPPHATHRTLTVATELCSRSLCDIESATTAVDGNFDCVCSLTGLREGSAYNLDSAQTTPDLHVSSIHWKPETSRMTYSQLAEYLAKSSSYVEIPSAKDIDQLELVALQAVHRVLEQVDPGTAADLPVHLRRYYTWMEHIAKSKADILALGPTNPDTGSPIATGDPPLVHDTKLTVAADFLHQTSQAMLSILQEKTTALDLLFNSGLDDRFSQCQLHALSYDRISTYVDLKAHQNPNIRILEIGAGSGGATQEILKALCNTGTNTDVLRFSEYYFTDVSSAFFETARATFEPFQSRMKFQTLDIERMPAEQGFEEHSFDVIIASRVLHGTRNLRRTLRHVRSLLREEGQLVLYETTGVDSARAGLTYGLLSGWWVGEEDERRMTPCVSAQGWHDALVDAGFTGVDVHLPDNASPEYTWFSVMLATAKREINGAVSDLERATIVITDNDPAQLSLATALTQCAPHLDVQTVEQLSSNTSETSAYCFLLDTSQSFLYDLSEAHFEILKSILASPRVRVLWVTTIDKTDVVTRPDRSLFTGLGRTLTTERRDCVYTELTLQDTNLAEAVVAISATLRRMLEGLDLELELRYENGLFYIPRVIPDTNMTQYLQAQITPALPRRRLLGEEMHRHLTLSIDVPGDLDTLHFIDMLDAQAPLSAGEILVEVKAVGLDMRDFLTAQGRASKQGFGSDFAGIIVRTTADDDNHVVGDRVFGYCASSALGTFVRTRPAHIARMDSSLSFTAAAGTPSAYAIAYYSLVVLARLESGESLLVHNAASNEGLAAILIAVAAGAEVYITADQGELSDLEAQVGSNKVRVFNQDMNPGPAFDLILDFKNEADQYSSWDLLAFGGKFIEASTNEGESKRHVQNLSDHGITYIRSDFATALSKSLGKADHLLTRSRQLISAVASSIEFPSPRVFQASELRSAFESVPAHSTYGKVVVEMSSDAEVPVTPAVRAPHQFSEHATYVVAGGFGGLGRVVVQWMVDRGARSFIVLSRSGASTEASKRLVNALRGRGVRIEYPTADLSSAESVKGAIESVQADMSPIKGCLQLAVVLSDSIFENMTYAQWLEATSPKTHGSWALHESLPKGMDFFIMMSSIAGVIGSAGQSNYAAGNTYQDALAHCRRAQGEHGVALDLGAISGIGLVAERNLAEDLKRRGIGPMLKPALLVCLEQCFSSGSPDFPEALQMITGLGHFTTLSKEGQNEIAWSKKPLFEVLRSASAKPVDTDSTQLASGEEQTVSAATLLPTAEDHASATQIVLVALKAKLSRVLSVPAADIDSALPIYAAGVDSLIALEVRNWFSTEVAADVPVAELMRDQSLFALAGLAAQRSTLVS